MTDIKVHPALIDRGGKCCADVATDEGSPRERVRQIAKAAGCEARVVKDLRPQLEIARDLLATEAGGIAELARRCGAGVGAATRAAQSMGIYWQLVDIGRRFTGPEPMIPDDAMRDLVRIIADASCTIMGVCRVTDMQHSTARLAAYRADPESAARLAYRVERHRAKQITTT